IENIKRHLGLGEQKREAILTAVKEVAAAITASTVTTVAVFLPLALVGDITGELFRPFAFTVTLALGASLFVSLTIVPVLAYWFLPRTEPVAEEPQVAPTHAGEPHPDDAPMPTVDAARLAELEKAERELSRPSLLQRSYLPVIGWTLKHSVV